MQKHSFIQHIKGNYGNDPFAWKVYFDILGWAITSQDSQIATMLTDKQAMRLIHIIRNSWIGPSEGQLP